MSKQDFSKYLVESGDVALISAWICENVPHKGIVRGQDLFAALRDKLSLKCTEGTFRVYLSHTVSNNYLPMIVGLRPYGYQRVLGDIPAPSNKRKAPKVKGHFIDSFASSI